MFKLKKMVACLLLVLVIISTTGCLFQKYNMIGSWEGEFQNMETVMHFTSETTGTIVFAEVIAYNLQCKKTGKATFEATYGYDSEYGWQHRKIVCEFTQRDKFTAKMYNQENSEIAYGVFSRQ